MSKPFDISQFKYKKKQKTETYSEENIQRSIEVKHLSNKHTNHESVVNCNFEATEEKQNIFDEESIFEDEASFDICFHGEENREKHLEEITISPPSQQINNNVLLNNVVSQKVTTNEDKSTCKKALYRENSFEDDFNDEAFETMLVQENIVENTCDDITLNYMKTPMIETSSVVQTTPPYPVQEVIFIEKSSSLNKISSSFRHETEYTSVPESFIQHQMPFRRDLGQKNLSSLHCVPSSTQDSLVSKDASVTLTLQKRLNSSLQPCANMSNESPERTVRKRKFPGPAGLLPDVPLEKSKVHIMELESPSRQSVRGFRYSQELLCSQTSVKDFEALSWQEMLKRTGNKVDLRLLERHNIRNVFQSAKRKCLPKHVVAKVLCVLLKKIKRGGICAEAIIKDETGEIAGKIDPKALDLYAEHFMPGVSLVLKEVSFLFNQFLLREENLVAVYDCDGKETVISDFPDVRSQSPGDSLVIDIPDTVSEKHVNNEMNAFAATKGANDDLLEDDWDDLLPHIDNFEDG